MDLWLIRDYFEIKLNKQVFFRMLILKGSNPSFSAEINKATVSQRLYLFFYYYLISKIKA
ncbi:hypothetical protein EG344_01880 [Chryseobacterium sp. G0162]|nr:hypothetical protein EG344_01880 [Chryseobacterium sp. G0162]